VKRAKLSATTIRRHLVDQLVVDLYHGLFRDRS
jgi:hypothetical protein